MLSKILLLALSFQLGPFYEQRPERDFYAVRPLWSETAATTDVLWPLFTSHGDWWRFCFLTHYQETSRGGYQFEVMPLWFNGRAAETSEPYGGLFPLWGTHPHILTLHDFRFCLWPLWMQYRMPRPSEDRWLTTNAVLFPFFSWRDDGSWGVWPLYGTSHNRADDHTYCLWPLWNRKVYREDRDTGGAGTAWMLWPLYGTVDRARESQTLVLPPLFSYVETPEGWRGRYPAWLVEIERMRRRDRTNVFPFYEKIVNRRYADGSEDSRLWRFGWRLVEILPDETRVFPFYVGRDDYLRIWPFWEASQGADGFEPVEYGRFLSLFPIRWVPSVDRNWAKFWTLYERVRHRHFTAHSLFWGIIRWRSGK